MIRKILNVPAFDQDNRQRVFSLTGLEKTASSLPKEARSSFSAALKNKIKQITPHQAFSYLVIIPIGAYEVWGPNAHGDAVLEDHLASKNWDTCEIYAKRPYGYRTFEAGKMFAHHKNKPQKGDKIYGDIIFTNYNWDMHWVELMVKAFRIPLQEDYPEILGWIDSGHGFDVSMGLYTLAEACSICGSTRRHASQPTCLHLSKEFVGTVMPDGRVACAINLYPKFHDISPVNIGADSVAHVIEKVASMGRSVDSGVPVNKFPRALIQRAVDNLARKGVLGGTKKVPGIPASGVAELEKRLGGKSVADRLVKLFSKEASINPSSLLAAGKKHGPPLLVSLIRNKVLLEPQEFTSAYLGALGPEQVELGKAMIRERERIPFPTDFPSVEPGELAATAGGAEEFVQDNLLSRSILPSILRTRLSMDMEGIDSKDGSSDSGNWHIEKNASLEAAYGRYLGMIVSVDNVKASTSTIRNTAVFSENRGMLGVEKTAQLSSKLKALALIPGLLIPLWLLTRTSKKDDTFNKEMELAVLREIASRKSPTIINPPSLPDLRPTALPYALLQSLLEK